MMVRQNDPAFPEAIRKFGCYFFSILAHCEMIFGEAMLIDDIMKIYVSATSSGIIAKETYDATGNLTDGCTVNSPIALFHLAGVGKYNWVSKTEASYVTKAKEIEILVFERKADTPAGMKNAKHTHFVAGDGKGKVMFDPLGPSNTVKYGTLISKRIFS